VSTLPEAYKAPLGPHARNPGTPRLDDVNRAAGALVPTEPAANASISGELM